MNAFDEIERAISTARVANIAADQNTEAMVKLVVGRLRNVKSYWGLKEIAKLKRELRSFNITTKRWD